MSFSSRSRKRFTTVLAAVTSFVCLSLTAAAQQAGGEVEERAPLGLRAGAGTLFPWIELRAGYDDNFNASASAPQSGNVSEIEAGLRWQSDWSRHRMSGELRGEAAALDADFGDAQGDGEARGDARIDISSRTSALVSGGYLFDFDGDTRDQTYVTAGELRHAFNRLSLALRAGVELKDYSSDRSAASSVAETDVADYRQDSLGLRAAYEISPISEVFAEAGINRRDYRQKVDSSGFLRGSQGYWGKLGLARSNGSKLRGEVALSYNRQDLEDTRLSTAEGFGIDAALAWQISALTELRFSARSGIGETTLAGASGYREQVGEVALSHQLGRRAALEGYLSYSRDDYVGVALVEETLEAGIGFDYFLSRASALTADYRHLRFASTQAGADYSSNRFTVGVRLAR